MQPCFTSLSVATIIIYRSNKKVNGHFRNRKVFFKPLPVGAAFLRSGGHRLDLFGGEKVGEFQAAIAAGFFGFVPEISVFYSIFCLEISQE